MPESDPTDLLAVDVMSLDVDDPKDVELIRAVIQSRSEPEEDLQALAETDPKAFVRRLRDRLREPDDRAIVSYFFRDMTGREWDGKERRPLVDYLVAKLGMRWHEAESLDTRGIALAIGGCSQDLVTLDQMAAIVNKHKRTLERCKTDGDLPEPAVEGGGGHSSYWDWAKVRPWLQEKYGMRLPTRFPPARRS